MVPLSLAIKIRDIDTCSNILIIMREFSRIDFNFLLSFGKIVGDIDIRIGYDFDSVIG